ncbi:MAG: sulfotransferase domain-containing protein [Phycisphaerales bacterium]
MDTHPDIFLLRGHARSGTNWIGRLLNLHPRVLCAGEWDFTELQDAFGRFVGALARCPRRPGAPSRARRSSGLPLRVLAVVCERKPGAIWIGERTPKPIEPTPIAEAPVIHVLRDGRDVLVSWTHHQLKRARTGEGGLAGRMGEQVAAYERNAEHFLEHPEHLLSDESWVRQIARQWGARNLADRDTIESARAGRTPYRVHALRYEDLLADVERERVGMYRFLALDPDEAAPLESGVKTGAGFESESPGAFNRKGEAGDWKNYFTGDARRWFKEEAGSALIELGYEERNDW